MRDQVRRAVSLLALLLGIAVVVGAVAYCDQVRREPEPLQIEFGQPALREITVDIGGAVANPGVYVLEVGARVEDALAQAGGTLDSADLDRVNRAALLVDGQALKIPTKGQAPASGLVDLNTATAAVLDTLPGVGEVRAERIVASREALGPFTRVEELTERGLVPASIVDQMRPLLAPVP